MSKTIDFVGFLSRLSGEKVMSGLKRKISSSGTPSVELAFELHLPNNSFSDLLIFYHGGGAHRRAGYDRLGDALVRDGGIAVCLPDLRGHGASGGRRGHAPTPDAIWDDVDRLVGAMRREFPGTRVHLGGHSSGAGMLLNHLTRRRPAEPVDGLVLLAPELGFRSGLYRDHSTFGSFARVSTWPFLLSAFSGGHLGAGIEAVRFDYGNAENVEGCLASYTVGMANAVTPTDPARQLGRLSVPTTIGLPENDELIDVERLEAFLARHAAKEVRWERLPGLGHLDVLLGAAPFIRSALLLDSPPGGGQ
ncbi:alpha/beta fold hydrolase [Methylobacterium nodulans]|uniref:Alpha/beta hydrolase fold protein n=1 Tax=Methylobacterium nodulans (strain LMG 21967 / CNCM I-2342 / ORS 2060) TaxID=460265 RepID=B8IN81_METNO|nr:alpha/beta fold hydrolase [Methylobacterium nodulans]ACL62197.1 alpha/beta hydrolase fold protein [Methylobacterium nodulans ORS 2060]